LKQYQEIIMKTSSIKNIGVGALFVLIASAAYADSDAELIYQPQTAHHGIYSYPASVPAEVSRSPELIYVDQAYGPAIYSYRHAGNETASAYNVEYVDTADSPAIYSYGKTKE
jgi:hypothetical protein